METDAKQLSRRSTHLHPWIALGVTAAELDALAYLVRSMNEAENGSALLGLGLILERHAKILEDLIASAYEEKP